MHGGAEWTTEERRNARITPFLTAVYTGSLPQARSTLALRVGDRRSNGRAERPSVGLDYAFLTL
jgi:hypothetical protein